MQGVEAGGHRGVFVDDDRASDLTLLAALQLIRAAVDVPLVAAGGLATGAAVGAVLVAGAAAAQVGTAYLRAEEAGTSEAQRERDRERDADGPHARVQRAARARDREPLARDAQRGGAARVSRGPPPHVAAARPRPQDRRRRRDQPVGRPGPPAGRGARSGRDHAPAGSRRARGDRSGRPAPVRMHDDEVAIDPALVGRLVAAQFPRLAGSPIRRVRSTGTVNAIYRLGDDLCARLPLVAKWADDLAREWEWLPRLAPALSLRVPEPVARGAASAEYPFPWAIYRWIEGEPYADERVADERRRRRRAGALRRRAARHRRRPAAPRAAGAGRCASSTPSPREAIAAVARRHRRRRGARRLAARARSTRLDGDPVWIHGDLLRPNLLVDGRPAPRGDRLRRRRRRRSRRRRGRRVERVRRAGRAAFRRRSASTTAPGSAPAATRCTRRP